MAKWHFRQKRPDDTSRESVSGEFFSNDSLHDGFAQGLVREAIQNSLDAYVLTASPLRVRIYLSEDAGAIGAEDAARFLGGLFPHLASEENERLDPPAETEPCQFLVFEDFQTKGLHGDVRAWRTKDGKDPFYLFFRSEGLSDKAREDRGRWGIGKFVFPRSSRARSFFGLTVRHDGEPAGPLLMGRAILRAHCIDDVDFVPDGYFGLQEPIADSVITTPVLGRVPGAVEFRMKRGGSLPAENGRCVTARWGTGEGAADAEKNREDGRDASPGHGGAAAAAAGTGSRSLESAAA